MATLATGILDWFGEILDDETPASGRMLRLLVVAVVASLAIATPAYAGIIEDAVRDGTQGMIDGIVTRVNNMATATIPTSFDNLFDGGPGSSHIYHKAVQMYAGGITRSIANTLLALVMLVQLVKITQRTEAHATFPAVREVATLLVACAIYTYLVGHAWDLLSTLFADLSGIWSSWDADAPVRVSSMEIDATDGLAMLLPMLVSALICSLCTDVAVIVAKVVVWGRGMQLYFMAAMSPIPMALLGIDETRHMGVGFLRNFASLVLGYAALSFVIKLFPTLLYMAIATSWIIGGDSDMLLSITAASVLQVILVVKCGSWAREVLGG